MRYLKEFQIFESNFQLWQFRVAEKYISEIYDIEDRYLMGNQFGDFMVSIDQFMKYAREHNGSFAGNYYSDLVDFDKDLKKLKSYGLNVYISPFWVSRKVSDIVNFGDVYGDTIYVRDNGDSKIESILKTLNPDELDPIVSLNGLRYYRLWWD